MAVKQHQDHGFDIIHYTLYSSAVTGQQKDVASMNKTQARIPGGLIFFEISGTESCQNSALFLPLFLLM